MAMRHGIRGGALFVALTLGCAASSWGSEWRVVETERDEAVGWVRLADGSVACLTWRAAGGLWLHDIPSLRIDALEAREDGAFAWPEEEATLAPVRADGSIVAWRMEGADGEATLEVIDDPPYEQRQVAFTSTDGVELFATLLLPTVDRPAPGAVVLQGSGESSRDNQWALTFADALARAGIATAHMDKRGSGMSGGDWREAGFDLLADDALAAMAALRAQPEVDAARTGFLGLSQGGWIAPIAAVELERQGEPVAFVATASSTVMTPLAQVRHEVEQDFRGAGLGEGAIERLLATIDLNMAYARTGEGWQAYMTALGALRADDALAPVAAEFPDDPEGWYMRFWRRIGSFDPAPLWGELDAPSLLLYGAEDESDNIPVGATVARLEAIGADAQGDIAWRVYDGMGHALFDIERGWVSERVLADLIAWIRSAAE